MRARLEGMVDRLGHAVLATSRDDRPYTSLVAVARVPGTSLLLFATARNTRKHRNIRANPRVCLMIDNRSHSRRDYLGAESLSVEGRARSLRRGRRRDEAAAVLALRHEALRGFIFDPATALVVVTPETIVHVSGFQQVTIWEG